MRTDIIFGILITLLNKNTVTCKYLSEKYEISTRTVLRYLTILDGNNIPIKTKSGRNGGITINNKLSILTIYFTEEEKYELLQLSQQISNKNLKINIQTKLLSLR